MTRSVRVALTETCNAYREMPARVADLPQLSGRLDEVRRANVEHNVELVTLAAAEGARVVGLGELCTGPYFALGREPFWCELAEDAREGPSVQAFRAAARAHGVVLVAPIYERCAATGQRFNTAVVIDAEGELLGKYRKTHIPAGTNEEGAFHEEAYYSPSDGRLGDLRANVSRSAYFPVFDTGPVRLGVAICYDRHFPGVMGTLARNGAELILCPAVTFGAKSRRMWELEFAVDAARENVFIGGSNRRGAEAPWNQEFFGASGFVGPNGPVAPLPAPAGLVLADLDLDTLAQPDPSGWDLARDRRPDIFGPD